MIDSIFSAYDRWNGLIPLLGGIYATLLAFGYLPRRPKDPERLALWHKRFGGLMKLLGPALILIGILSVVASISSSREQEAQMQLAKDAITMHRQNAGTASSDGWYHADSTDGDYSIEMPLPFNDFTVRVKESGGRLVKSYGLGAKSKEGITISAVEIPADSRKLTALQTYTETKKGGLVVEDKTRMFEYADGNAVEWLEQNSEKASYIRAIDFDRYTIIIGITYPRSADLIVAKFEKKFFESLKLKESNQSAQPTRTTGG